MPLPEVRVRKHERRQRRSPWHGNEYARHRPVFRLAKRLRDVEDKLERYSASLPGDPTLSARVELIRIIHEVEEDEQYQVRMRTQEFMEK